MFSGIVEAVVPALRGEAKSGLYRLVLRRPAEFTDIKGGDSIAVDGACLTVEEFDHESMTFALAAETLKVLRWNPDQLLSRTFNLERSLRFGDRLHGHLVSGHVDALGEVLRAEQDGESLFLDVKVPASLRSYVWKKGSLAIHGVSLTINELKDDVVSVCLIPETQKRTNLSKLKVGDSVHLESDMIARAVVRALETGVATSAQAKEDRP
ncbi:MAG: riboflavin synthase [Bdellovibrionaceae bacterium]|nr:riboflavin synthase [Pseudobdellovibrionaceae bacterium]